MTSRQDGAGRVDWRREIRALYFSCVRVPDLDNTSVVLERRDPPHPDPPAVPPLLRNHAVNYRKASERYRRLLNCRLHTAVQMEAMEVDSPGEVDEQPQAALADQADANASVVIVDSGSSTEVDEDEEDNGGGQGAARTPPRLPATWAFSQRAVGRTATTSSSARGAPIRRRLRQGLRVHYPSQTAAPSRRFPDFLLRAPAASAAEPGSGSSTEVSDSDEEDMARQDEAGESALAASLPASPQPNAPHHTQQQETSSEGTALATDNGKKDAEQQSTQSKPGTSASVQLPLSEDGEGDTCTICFEPWTTAGEHRLAALRCGHLFGFTCIQRWLKAQSQLAKCPQCNKKAKRSDIVLLYAPKLRAVDNTEQESLKRSLEHEQSLRRRAEMESAEYKLKLQVITNKYGQVERELQELKCLVAHTGRSTVSSSSSSSSCSAFGSASALGLSQRGEGARSAQYSFSRAILVSQAGGCRVLSYCEPLSCLLASQPSPHATLVPGYGVKKVSVVNMKASQYVPIHSKQIRGLSFNGQNDSLLLSAALDNTVKLTSLVTNTVVQTYNAGKPVWSCCWCLDNTTYVYAGLSNGSVLVYDTRDTSTHVQELEPLRSRCPVASLCYIPRAASSSFPCGGLIAGSLEGGCFWEHVNEATFRPHVLPLESAGCTDIQVEPESRHCLVTYRPGRSNPSLRCVLMAMNRASQQDASELPICSCSPVQMFSAGSSCKLLTKNAVFRSPNGGGTLVCAGDEASNSTMVWDAGSGSLLQKLPADLPVLDISPFSVNGEHFLASLTEKMLKVYKWE